MPVDQLYTNRIRIQPETVIGDGGDDSDVFDCRLTGANVNKETHGKHERIDPWRTLEFSEDTGSSWQLTIGGELLSVGNFANWLLAHISEDIGATERSLDIAEIRGRSRTPTTLAIQFDGIDGTSTFYGAALSRLTFETQERAPVTWKADFVALSRSTTDTLWTGTTTDTGIVIPSSESRLALGSDFASDPDSSAVDCFSIALQIMRQGQAAADISPDGVPRGHQTTVWDLVGSMTLPETAGITATAFETLWNGELNLALSTNAARRIEIEAPIVGRTSQREGLSHNFKEVKVDFVSRRGIGDPIARILTT